MAIWAMTKIVGKSEAWLGQWGSSLNQHFNDCSPHDLGLPKQVVIQQLTDKLNAVTQISDGH